MLPAPIVLPNDHWPVEVLIVVRRFVFEDPCPDPAIEVAGLLVGPPLEGGPAMSVLYRELLGLELLLCVLRLVSVRLAGGGPTYGRSLEELRREEGGRARLVVS